MNLNSVRLEVQDGGRSLRVWREDRLEVEEGSTSPPDCPEGWQVFLIRVMDWDGAEWSMVKMMMRYRSPSGYQM